MTDLSIRKKNKITITASSEGVKIAENALIRLGFESKSDFAKSKFLARSTVTDFFLRRPIQVNSFKTICHALQLDWMRIAELSEVEPSQVPGITACINPDIHEGVEKMLTPTFDHKVIVIDKKTNTIKAEIKLIGDINSLGNSSMVEFILRQFAGDTIKITDIKEGSIRLTVEGSQEDIDRLVSLIKSGELKEVSGFPVEDVQILSESSEDDESNELNNKWCLVREIVTQGIRDRNLSGVDLSDADLSGADLSGADLSGADLSGADLSGADLSSANLSGANLSGANLSGADLNCAFLSRAFLSRAFLINANLIGANLSGANLSGADLSGAYLIRANLSGANLSGANLSGADLRSANVSGANLRGADLSKTKVKQARFSSNSGISESMKQNLIRQGAIFEDSPGNRSEVLTKV
jgi:uncharacterized protein YjbI with pentapeptide repeats